MIDGGTKILQFAARRCVSAALFNVGVAGVATDIVERPAAPEGAQKLDPVGRSCRIGVPAPLFHMALVLLRTVALLLVTGRKNDLLEICRKDVINQNLRRVAQT